MILLTLLFVFQGFVPEGPLPPVEPAGRQVVTARAIRESGLVRLGDLFRLLEGWTYDTVDGFSWNANPAPYPSSHPPQWVLLLDGHRIEHGLFGPAALDALPVTPGEIDSIEVFTAPVLHRGVFAEGGLVHIHTSRPPPGAAASLRYAVGNESGDPGPYRYTPFATINVDKAAQDVSGHAGYGAGPWLVRAGGASLRHFATDAAVVQRTADALAGTVRPYPEMTVAAGGVALGYRGSRAEHRLFVGGSAFSDLRYVEPLGREVPLWSRRAHAHWAGSRAVGPRLRLSFDLGHAREALEERRNAYGFDPGWSRRVSSARIGAAYAGGALRGGAGASYEHHAVRTAHALRRGAFGLAGLHGELRHAGFRGWLPEIAFRASVSGGRATAKATAAVSRAVGRRHLLRLGFTSAERLPEEEAGLWFWTTRGYDFLSASGGVHALEGALEGSRRRTARADWRYDAGRGLRLEASLAHGELAGLHLERQTIRRSGTGRTLSSPVRVETGLRGGVLAGSFGAEHRPSPRLRHAVRYDHARARSGDPLFRAEWESVPAHRIQYTVAFAPVEDFSARSVLRYRSASRWAPYEGGGRPAEVGAAVVVDFAVQKWFWKRSLRGAVLLRNVTGAEERYHPAGAGFDPTLYVQIEIFPHALRR